MKHYGDITKINGADLENVSCICGGSPCFVAGTLVLTEQGYMPIEELKVGDLVYTHAGNWKPIEKIGNSISDTVIVKGSQYGIECTKEHHFYSADNVLRYSNKKAIRTIENIDWRPAKDLLGLRYASPKYFPESTIPEITKKNNLENDPPIINEDLFYFIGRYLGDGWIQNNIRADRDGEQRNNLIIICDSLDKEEELKNLYTKISPNYNVEHCRTAVKYKMISSPLVRWLNQWFSTGSLNKTLPGWIFGIKEEYRRALLKGYMDSDGNKKSPTSYKFASVSHKLIQGMRLIAESLGYSCSITINRVEPTCVIEGRTVNQHDWYALSISENKVKPFIDSEFYHWYKVKSVNDGHKDVMVYNIQVKDDHSYIANGFVVHNCQDLSIAGNRSGLDGERSGLFMEQIRIIKEMRNEAIKKSIKPVRFAIWENVQGAFSSNSGEDFRTVLEEFIHIKEASFTVPRCEKWEHAGCIIGNGWSIAWRLMDAQYWGVPQRRKRIALLADLDGEEAGHILLCDDVQSDRSTDSGHTQSSFMGSGDECRPEVQSLTESLFGNIKSCIPPWKGIARNPEESTDECYTLKLRHTGSDTKGGGVGPLIQDNLSSTLSCNQDQTLFMIDRNCQ